MDKTLSDLSEKMRDIDFAMPSTMRPAARSARDR